MQSEEIRNRFLEFFENRGHAIIPSASLVPEGDASTLFINSGMQPLVPYLSGERHPKGNKLVNIQKSWRTGDIDEVGDNTHNTFFEMLGRWYLSDFTKKEVIESTFEFLTTKEGLGLDSNRIYASIFAGNNDAPQDKEVAGIWKSLGVPYYFRGIDDNWWSSGDNGPCGPDSEIFYDVTKNGLGTLSPEDFQKADDEQKVIEIWNDVFMEYEKKDGEVVGKLAQQNVDTGVGLERTTAIVQGKNNIFETDLFKPLIDIAKKLTTDLNSQRILADHFRSAVFAIADGVLPSNTDRGYVLRRLIRRAIMQTDAKKLLPNTLIIFINTVVKTYGNIYPEIKENVEHIQSVFIDEVKRFTKTLTRGHKKLISMSLGISENTILGKDLFDMYQTYGYPFELSIEELNSKILPELKLKQLSKEKIETLKIDFKKEFKKHQNSSRTATVGKFKGGLADSGEETTKLHTAHHLLLAALQKILGSEIKQRGSNITPERLRIDFSFDRKLTDEEKQEVEKQVNQWITQNLEVIRKEMSRKEAKQIGAEMEFGQKYSDTVSVYFIQDENGIAISKEFCGGPHVKKIGKLGIFSIKKETSSSAGVRRIKAVLQ